MDEEKVAVSSAQTVSLSSGEPGEGKNDKAEDNPVSEEMEEKELTIVPQTIVEDEPSLEDVDAKREMPPEVLVSDKTDESLPPPAITSQEDSKIAESSEAGILKSDIEIGLEQMKTECETDDYVTSTRNNECLPPPTPSSSSTLLIRRQGGTTGTPTYVVSPGSSSSVIKEEASSSISPTIVADLKPPMATIMGLNLNPPIKRRPGRPVGSVGPYKRKKLQVQSTDTVRHGEVRVSSRYSTSIFKHEIPGTTVPPPPPVVQEDSPWVYPTAIRNSQISGGKPPLAGFRRPYTKGGHKKESFDNIDPLTGKRKYTKKKKLFGDIERRDTLTEELSGESDSETDKYLEFHLSDNGIWRPTDDLRLMINMEQRGTLEDVHIGVKFSCFFTYKEIEERWKKLMYNEKACSVSQNAISALHPDVKAKIYYESLFSEEEENLIAGISMKPDANPDIKLFKALLVKNADSFNKHRTARSLMMHWLDMKDFNLLSNQNALDYNPGRNFEDFEGMICENDDDSDDDIESESVLLEIKTEERCLKKKLKLLDDEINAWQAITGQIIEDGLKSNTLPLPPHPTDFDAKTFALLRGKEVYYGMTSREIILGRSTAECKVDADLTEEGASSKISRKQAMIQLRRLGRFVIINKGRRPIFVDKKVVQHRCEVVLHDQSVIQIAQISLIFFINEALIARVMERDVSGEIYASFRDLENESPSPSIPQPSSTFPRFCSPYTSFLPYGMMSNYRNNSTTITRNYDNSDYSINSSNNAGDGDADVPLCQPPASYVTIS